MSDTSAYLILAALGLLFIFGLIVYNPEGRSVNPKVYSESYSKCVEQYSKIEVQRSISVHDIHNACTSFASAASKVK